MKKGSELKPKIDTSSIIKRCAEEHYSDKIREGFKFQGNYLLSERDEKIEYFGAKDLESFIGEAWFNGQKEIKYGVAYSHFTRPIK